MHPPRTTFKVRTPKGRVLKYDKNPEFLGEEQRVSFRYDRGSVPGPLTIEEKKALTQTSAPFKLPRKLLDEKKLTAQVERTKQELDSQQHLTLDSRTEYNYRLRNYAGQRETLSALQKLSVEFKAEVVRQNEITEKAEATAAAEEKQQKELREKEETEATVERERQREVGKKAAAVEREQQRKIREKAEAAAAVERKLHIKIFGQSTNTVTREQLKNTLNTHLYDKQRARLNPKVEFPHQIINKDRLILFLKNYRKLPQKHGFFGGLCSKYNKNNKDPIAEKLLRILEKNTTEEFSYFELGALANSDDLLKNIIYTFKEISELTGLISTLNTHLTKEKDFYRRDKRLDIHRIVRIGQNPPRLYEDEYYKDEYKREHTAEHKHEYKDEHKDEDKREYTSEKRRM